MVASQIARAGHLIKLAMILTQQNTSRQCKKSLCHLEAGVWEQKVYARKTDKIRRWLRLHAWMGVPQRSTKRNPLS